MKKALVCFVLILFGLSLEMVLGLTVWSNNSYEPSEDMWEEVAQDHYEVVGDFIVFTIEGTPTGEGVIFYPGALIDPLGYGYLARRLAAQGILVCILSVPFHLSIFDSMKAGDFIVEHPEIDTWYVGGHSMGGVSAAMFAARNPTLVDGVLFLASYPSSSTNLSSTDLDVLSIYAELDGLTTLQDIEDSKALLPEDSSFVKIPGGNHAQFGWYGEQKGDLAATISVRSQQDQIFNAIWQFLSQNP